MKLIKLIPALLIPYGVFAFGLWELNPGEWSDWSRFMCTLAAFWVWLFLHIE